MDFIDKNIENYAILHSEKESDLLAELNRETHLKALMPRMLSGHLQGRVLSMISKMIKPQRILEIGTYTGYSALCLAEGLGKDGKLFTIDINEELSEMVKNYFKQSPHAKQLHYLIGNALEIIPGLEDEFDLVFIDADKENYINYYDMIIDKVKPGGFILADNVLWSGKVLQNSEKTDKDTEIIKKYNQKIAADNRVECVLLPIRDGIMIARKKN